MECFTLKLGNWKSCKKLEIKVNRVLASAANILKLEQYKEDQRDPCTRMNANSWTIPYFGELIVVLCDHLEGWGIGGKFQRERIYVYLWLIHIVVWQKSTHYCKAIILHLKKKGSSLVVQCWNPTFPLQGAQVWSLIGGQKILQATRHSQKKK